MPFAELIRSGDPEVIRRVVDANSPAVRAYATNAVGPEGADGAIHDAFAHFFTTVHDAGQLGDAKVARLLLRATRHASLERSGVLGLVREAHPGREPSGGECRETAAELLAIAQGRRQPGRAQRAADEIDACPACAELWRRFTEAERAYADRPKGPRPSASLRAAICQQALGILDARQRRPSDRELSVPTRPATAAGTGSLDDPGSTSSPPAPAPSGASAWLPVGIETAARRSDEASARSPERATSSWLPPGFVAGKGEAPASTSAGADAEAGKSTSSWLPPELEAQEMEAAPDAPHASVGHSVGSWRPEGSATSAPVVAAVAAPGEWEPDAPVLDTIEPDVDRSEGKPGAMSAIAAGVADRRGKPGSRVAAGAGRQWRLLALGGALLLVVLVVAGLALTGAFASGDKPDAHHRSRADVHRQRSASSAIEARRAAARVRAERRRAAARRRRREAAARRAAHQTSAAAQSPVTPYHAPSAPSPAAAPQASVPAPTATPNATPTPHAKAPVAKPRKQQIKPSPTAQTQPTTTQPTTQPAPSSGTPAQPPTQSGPLPQISLPPVVP